MTGAGGRLPVPPCRRISSGYAPERDIAARTVTLACHSPFSGRGHPGGQGCSEVAPAGLVARASSAQVLPALERPAEVAETGHERDERIEDDTQRR
jgi:hypothetical protein